MRSCSDAQLTYLNELGYNVVRLPREGVEPLDVIGTDRVHHENLGAIDRLWHASAPRPQVDGPLSVARINGARTSQLDLSVGTAVLAGVLQGMGAATSEMGWVFRGARRLQFEFTEVQAYAVDPVRLGTFLESGDLNPSHARASRYFLGDDTTAYVITETLKARSVGLSAIDPTGQEMHVNSGAMAEAAGPGIEIAVKTTGQLVLRYLGASSLTFGFKLLRVLYEDGRWVVRGQRPAVDVPADVGWEKGILLRPGLVPGDFRRR